MSYEHGTMDRSNGHLIHADLEKRIDVLFLLLFSPLTLHIKFEILFYYAFMKNYNSHQVSHSKILSQILKLVIHSFDDSSVGFVCTSHVTMCRSLTPRGCFGFGKRD